MDWILRETLLHKMSNEYVVQTDRALTSEQAKQIEHVLRLYLSQHGDIIEEDLRAFYNASIDRILGVEILDDWKLCE